MSNTFAMYFNVNTSYFAIYFTLKLKIIDYLSQLVGDASGNMGLCECRCIWTSNYCKFSRFYLKVTIYQC